MGPEEMWASLNAGPYADFGCFPKYYVMHMDANVLCHGCMLDEANSGEIQESDWITIECHVKRDDVEELACDACMRLIERDIVGMVS